MRAAIGIMAMLLAAAGVRAQPVSYHTGGRSADVVTLLDGVDDNGKTASREIESEEHQWPGAYFEARFKGKRLYTYLADDHDRFNLLVDGTPVATIDCAQTPCARDKPEITKLKTGGWHTARLEALTENTSGSYIFDGFGARGGKVETLAPRARQVEIIGDSYAAGYGTHSSKHECSPEDIRLTTDTQQAFGALLGKHYDADYQINAVSGIGMVRNYGGNDDRHPVMPKIYPYALLDSRYTYTDPQWQPQVVIIALGDNDFATTLSNDEKWPNDAALREDFITTYVRFVQSVRAQNPKATFILMDFNELTLPAILAEVADRLKAAGETRVLLYHPGGGDFEQTGCDWHLSLNDHQRLATGLEAVIDSTPDIWQGH